MDKRSLCPAVGCQLCKSHDAVPFAVLYFYSLICDSDSSKIHTTITMNLTWEKGCIILHNVYISYLPSNHIRHVLKSTIFYLKVLLYINLYNVVVLDEWR